MNKSKEQEKPKGSPAGKHPASKVAYPTNPPPAAVQEQIKHGGLPADHPLRSPVPESRNPQTENERLVNAEQERMENAQKASQKA